MHKQVISTNYIIKSKNYKVILKFYTCGWFADIRKPSASANHPQIIRIRKQSASATFADIRKHPHPQTIRIRKSSASLYI